MDSFFCVSLRVCLFACVSSRVSLRVCLFACVSVLTSVLLAYISFLRAVFLCALYYFRVVEYSCRLSAFFARYSPRGGGIPRKQGEGGELPILSFFYFFILFQLLCIYICCYNALFGYFL